MLENIDKGKILKDPKKAKGFISVLKVDSHIIKKLNPKDNGHII